jgi:hypothetical protein
VYHPPGLKSWVFSARRSSSSRRPKKARRQRQGPTAKDKATFVWKQGVLMAKRTVKLTKADWDDRVGLSFMQ